MAALDCSHKVPEPYYADGTTHTFKRKNKMDNKNTSKTEVEANINAGDLKRIATARDEQAINKAVEEGFFPLIKKVVPAAALHTKFAVVQNLQTGHITVVTDYRDRTHSNFEGGKFKTVIPFSFYYPYVFASPFAAYLIPKDLKVSERVLLLDLIEDYVGGTWNQGDTFRLESCEAIWNGVDFDIQYDPALNRTDFIG